jgi:hypothetical protein
MYLGLVSPSREYSIKYSGIIILLSIIKKSFGASWPALIELDDLTLKTASAV